MPITEQQLLQILPNAGPRAGVFVGALNRGMTRFGITSPVRAAAFLAQVGHESGQLTRLVENLNYSARGLAATWPSRPMKCEHCGTTDPKARFEWANVSGRHHDPNDY
ncbi:hypothetical protein ACLXBB_36355, partial [Pseudomonas aeruginosa]